MYPSSSAAEIGQTADPLRGTAYALERRLGAGGMGEVLLVRHRQLGRLCVAKVLHARLCGDPRLVERLRLEAQALGRLEHPHIVQVLGFDHTADERPFIVLEHLPGRTLADELEARGGRLPIEEALVYTSQLLSALAAAHQLGIVHRDIKPDNLILCEDHGRRSLKVVDFGVARVLPGVSPHAPAPLALPTETGRIVGTPLFLSPEAALGEEIDGRADLYAAALVFYTCVAGRGPFDEQLGAEGVIAAHAFESPAPLSAVASERIPDALDALILQMLDKSPDRRLQTAREFRGALDLVAVGMEVRGAALTDELKAGAVPEAKSLPVGPAEAPRGAPDPWRELWSLRGIVHDIREARSWTLFVLVTSGTAMVIMVGALLLTWLGDAR